MTVHDSSTLAALIAAYDKSVVFEESVPRAMQVAKALPALHWSNGGLLLLGVRKDGTVTGVEEGEVDGIFERFGHLCAELTKTSVEIGLLRIDGRRVVFLVFNMIPRHTDPLDRYAGKIERLAVGSDAHPLGPPPTNPRKRRTRMSALHGKRQGRETRPLLGSSAYFGIASVWPGLIIAPFTPFAFCSAPTVVP